MFFQQTQTARNAVEEAEENELGGYYLDPPPWFIAGNKRMSTASALSSRSRWSGGNASVNGPSPATSVESALPSRRTSVISRGPGLYGRQTSAARSSASLPPHQARRGFAAAQPRANTAWSRFKRLLSSSLGLFLLIQTYLCIGAVCFMWLEAAKEAEQMELLASQRLAVAEKLVVCTGNVSCHAQILRKWEHDLVKFPQIYLEIDNDRVWSWVDSYYCSFTIISTIGYGNVTPLSVLGRLYAVAYAVIGIPMMLLFITDIGNKFARWTKIAIIKFRQCKYKLCSNCQERRRKDDWGKSAPEPDEEPMGDGGGSGSEGREVRGGDPSPRDEGARTWSIPEVHINIAMSTLDEEAWELETKDIAGTVDEEEGEERYSGYGELEAGLHVSRDNSDYGGSSTGVEACIIDPKDGPHAVEPGPTTGVPIPAGLSTEGVQGTSEMELHSCLGDAEELGSSSRERASDSSSPGASPDDVIVSVDTVTDNQPSDLRDASFRESSDARVDSKHPDVSRSPESLEVRNGVCKCEPSDVLHTSPLRKETVAGGKTYEECGQPVQNAGHAKHDENAEPECSTPAAGEKGRKLELASDSGAVDSAITETVSTDSVSVDAEAKRPLEESLVLRKEDIPQFVATYFRHDSVMDGEYVGVESRQKSRSLEGINTRAEAEPPLLHRPAAVSGRQDRRTSAPNVSFQAGRPRPNGRLPNRRASPGREADDDADGEFRDKPATDSGVVSSSSNSTECSPKRRPTNSPHHSHRPRSLAVGDSSDDTRGRPADAASDGNDRDEDDDEDVMDSEEEKSFDKPRQLRLGAARTSTADRELVRVSEADIAMLSIPLWLALLLLLVYLLLGAGCFAAMQGWTFLDGFYYCFISLSTIGFGDLVFLPQKLHAGLIFSFLYSFVGLCFTSMCMSLSSIELTLLSRRIASTFGVYRGRIRSMRVRRWKSRRRLAIRASPPER